MHHSLSPAIERPGHKQVATSAAARLEMARAAFPDDDVVLDSEARTVDTLRAHPEWDDPLFLIGADGVRSRRQCRRQSPVVEGHDHLLGGAGVSASWNARLA